MHSLSLYIVFKRRCGSTQTANSIQRTAILCHQADQSTNPRVMDRKRHGIGNTAYSCQVLFEHMVLASNIRSHRRMTVVLSTAASLASGRFNDFLKKNMTADFKVQSDMKAPSPATLSRSNLILVHSRRVNFEFVCFGRKRLEFDFLVSFYFMTFCSTL